MKRVVLVGAAALALSGCGRGGAPRAPASPSPAARACASIGARVQSFGELLEEATAGTRGRVVSYAGVLSLLLSFESAAAELERELGAVPARDGDLGARVAAARRALDDAAALAQKERESIEAHAREIAPLAEETQRAWGALRASCATAKDGRSGRECAAVRDGLEKLDAAETVSAHERAVLAIAAARLTSPELSRARDRAVAASRAAEEAVRSRSADAASLQGRWSAAQRDVSAALADVAGACRGVPPAGPGELVAAAKPDPRKLTVLVRVKPPPGIERALSDLAKEAEDDDERAFYEARAKGAFGSGFFVVRDTKGRGREALVITNRHVVELGDSALLEIADGTKLGRAEIVYTDPIHDVAILRPVAKVAVDGGFAFAELPAKDQQVVVATGFPGMGGRPSYQTTRGYVSNESFRLDEASPDEPSPRGGVTYVQHTAPIDPGSSGGPLTDDAGRVLGVNTLKVTNREAVAFAVPSSSVLETLRRADGVEARRGSAPYRRASARLACLAFVGELAGVEPRVLRLEAMISNELTSRAGLVAAAALGGDETFERVWQADSVRAMRIATLVWIRAALGTGGGVSALETCDRPNANDQRDIAKLSRVRYTVRLGNFETRELAFRWEQGHWKVAGLDGSSRAPDAAPKRPRIKPPPKGRDKTPPPTRPRK